MSEHEHRQPKEETNESEPRIPLRIYAASLVDYNNGRLHGEWIDAAQDADDLYRDVQAMLARSPETQLTGDPAEEWAIHDYEGFGPVRLGEYESLEVVARLASGIAEHGLVFAAWAELSDARDPAMLGRFDEAYQGSFESRVAFAEHVIEELEIETRLQEHVPDWLRSYVSIDYQGIAQELEISGDIAFADRESGGVHVFDGRI